MMTGNATPAAKHDRLRRLRHLFSSSSTAGLDQADHLASPPTPLPPSKRSIYQSTSSISTSSSLRAQKSNAPAYTQLPASQTGQPDPIGLTNKQAIGREFLGKTLLSLSKDDRAIIQEYILPTTEDIDSVLQNALSAAEEKLKLCENKRWVFTFGGHFVRLRDEADKVILWLDRFKQVGDIAVNVDPIHAGLPWAGIRFLLEVRSIMLEWLFSFYFSNFQVTCHCLITHRQLQLNTARWAPSWSALTLHST
jgi:hypothetical protein